jgi:putative hydrolase of the HAD superfamily
MRIRFRQRPRSGQVCWWIDLDNTLHDASAHILPEIDRSMTSYVAQTLQVDESVASFVRHDYWIRYGATLLGLVKHHKVNAPDFLHRTHVLPELHRQVVPNPRMRGLLNALPGHRILLTNAPLQYATRVMKHLGIEKAFHAVVAIDHMWIHGSLRPKPSALLWPYLRRQVAARRHVLFEDTLGHLKQVRSRRMHTAWIEPRGLLARGRAGRPAFVDSKVKHFAQARAWAYRVAQTGQAGSRRTLMR